MTRARPAMTQIHQGMSTPYSALIDGSRTVLARNARVSAPTGGSQIENSTPAKNPARGWKARAIQVYQPPADGNTLASWAAFSACRASSAPPNRYAHGVTTAAKLTMNTNDARIANDGAIVAIPCISIPGIPMAFSCSPVLTVPWLVLTSSTATVSLLPVARRRQNPALGGAFAHGLIIRSIPEYRPAGWNLARPQSRRSPGSSGPARSGHDGRDRAG